MTVKVLIDMNLSPDWVRVLRHHGRMAVRWSAVGDPRATDRPIMNWVVANGYIVFTHDLGYCTMPALTHATGPSVLQVRAEDVLPGHLEGVVIAALRQHDAHLAAGALASATWTKRLNGT